MKVSTSLLAALLTALALSASAQELKFVSTQPSPLKQAGTINVNETSFTGTIRISGTFETIWEPGSEGYPGYYRVVLRPDKESRKVLPYDPQRGPVREIWLRNAETAMTTLMSPQKREELRSSRARTATGDVTALLTSYRTGVDCDQRGYNALLVRLVRPPLKVAVGVPNKSTTSGC